MVACSDALSTLSFAESCVYVCWFTVNYCGRNKSTIATCRFLELACMCAISKAPPIGAHLVQQATALVIDNPHTTDLSH
jgi:hypothetical protein